MGSDPFMVKDECTYVNVWLQKIIINSTIMHEKKYFLEELHIFKFYSFLDLSFSSSSSSVICQTTGPKSLPKRFLHIVRSRASSFNWQYPLLSLSSSSSFLRLRPCLVVTSICPFLSFYIRIILINVLTNQWSRLEIRMQDEITVWGLIIVPLRGWKSLNTWEQL